MQAKKAAHARLINVTHKRNTPWQRLICWCGLLLAMASCSGQAAAPPTRSGPAATSAALATAIRASAQPPLDLDALRRDLEAAQARWEDQQIERYQVEVRYRQAAWSTQILQLTVQDGVVESFDHTCFPIQGCVLRDLEPSEFVVERLFEVAAQVIALGQIEELTFNPTVGYPNAIITADGSWTVSGFMKLTP